MPDQVMPDSRVVDALQDIATVCRDSQEGYKRAAEQTSDTSLRSMFMDFARRREQEADELDRLIRAHGGQPVSHSGSLTGQAHRVFVSLRAALTGNDRAAALHEVARGESYAEAAFDRAKRMDLQGETRDVVARLHDSVKQTRDKVRRMAQAEGSGWSIPGAQRYLDGAQRTIAENAVTSSLVALGVGFVIGALAVLAARPTRMGNGASVRRADIDGPRAGV